MVVIEMITGNDIEAPPDANVCAICLDVNSASRWKCKQCGTIFHKRCIREWETLNIYYPDFCACPVCKLKYKLYNRTCIYKQIWNLNTCLGVFICIVIAAVVFIISNILFIMYLFMMRQYRNQ